MKCSLFQTKVIVCNGQSGNSEAFCPSGRKFACDQFFCSFTLEGSRKSREDAVSKSHELFLAPVPKMLAQKMKKWAIADLALLLNVLWKLRLSLNKFSFHCCRTNKEDVAGIIIVISSIEYRCQNVWTEGNQRFPHYLNIPFVDWEEKNAFVGFMQIHMVTSTLKETGTISNWVVNDIWSFSFQNLTGNSLFPFFFLPHPPLSLS